MSDRDNYYIILGLDPSVKDDASINKAIEDKRREWSRDINHPENGILARRNLQKINDMQKTLSDPGQRDMEAEAAKKILQAQKRETHRKLREAASIVIEDGKIQEHGLSELAKRFKMPKAEILKILKVTVENGGDDRIQPLDASIAKKIQTALDIVGKRDLFDFLGIAQTSSCAVLLKKANEVYERNSRNVNKTAEVSAALELVSACKTCFKDDDAKKSYLKMLSLKVFEDIDDMLNLVAARGIISGQAYKKIIKACADRGIPADRAESYVHEYCKRKNIPPPDKTEKPRPADKSDQVQCRDCGHPNASAAKVCGNCGSPLTIECPKCGKKVRPGLSECTNPNCGFRVCDMPKAITLLRKAENELNNHNNAKAKELLDEAEIYNPKHIDIKRLRDELHERNSGVVWTVLGSLLGVIVLFKCIC